LADEPGAPPRSGWARLAPELLVTDFDASLGFWRDLLGFRVAYRRSGFVYLERMEGAQIMLFRRDGALETGPMDRPFGRGVLLQVSVDDLTPVADALSARGWPLHTPIQEVWRLWGDREGGRLEFFVQDPDGYLVMVAEHIGERPIPR
jgi:catechol 2,3-dioxygenase-like lactoylglutathione lyase family enzyme